MNVWRIGLNEHTKEEEEEEEEEEERRLRNLRLNLRLGLWELIWDSTLGSACPKYERNPTSKIDSTVAGKGGAVSRKLSSPPYNNRIVAREISAKLYLLFQLLLSY